MLGTVLDYLRNWFLVPNGIRCGTYTVQDGDITLPFLQKGQYFRVVGSVFNDGVYKYGEVTLKDETFTGCICALAIPNAVLELVQEIEAWQEKNSAVASAPYQSESFGGYSYTLKSGADGGAVSWQDAFSDRLNQWRKI